MRGMVFFEGEKNNTEKLWEIIQPNVPILILP